MIVYQLRRRREFAGAIPSQSARSGSVVREAAEPLDRLLAASAVEIVFQPLQCRRDNVTMVNVRADHFDRLGPEPVNAFDVGAGKIWRVRAQRETLYATVFAEHDEPRRDPARKRCRRLLRAEQSDQRLRRVRRIRLPDGGLRPDARRRPDQASDVRAGAHEQRDLATVPFAMALTG